MNKFSKVLKGLRIDKGLTQKYLAEKLQVSERLVSYWENGKRECGFDMLIRIADFFDVPIDYLLGRIEY